MLGIEVTDAFEVSLGNHRSRVVADHTPSLACRERPQGQLAGFVVHIETRFNDIADELRVDKGHLRMP